VECDQDTLSRVIETHCVVEFDQDETWGAGVETQENKKIFVLCQKKTERKNLMSAGRRRLLQHYWYKVHV